MREDQVGLFVQLSPRASQQSPRYAVITNACSYLAVQKNDSGRNAYAGTLSASEVRVRVRSQRVFAFVPYSASQHMFYQTLIPLTFAYADMASREFT